MPNISWLKYIKLYKRGRNSNTHFNFTGIKIIHWEKNSKRIKTVKAWKLNTKYYGYLILPSLDNFKPWKNNEQKGKGALDPPHSPPKKVCFYGITTFFQIYCEKYQFLLEFSMIYLPNYK